MPAVLVTEPTVMQNSLFLLWWWPKPSPVLIVPTHKGIARLSWPGWLVKHRGGLLLLVWRLSRVTHPSTNQARCWLTSLLQRTMLTVTTTLSHHHKSMSIKRYCIILRHHTGNRKYKLSTCIVYCSINSITHIDVGIQATACTGMIWNDNDIQAVCMPVKQCYQWYTSTCRCEVHC